MLTKPFGRRVWGSPIGHRNIVDAGANTHKINYTTHHICMQLEQYPTATSLSPLGNSIGSGGLSSSRNELGEGRMRCLTRTSTASSKNTDPWGKRHTSVPPCHLACTPLLLGRIRLSSAQLVERRRGYRRLTSLKYLRGNSRRFLMVHNYGIPTE